MKQTISLLGFLILLGIAQSAFSHGTVIYPASRIYNCYNNPSTPICTPCGNAIYDWMGVLQPHTNYGDHLAFVPDGQIASGGNGSSVDFSCLDALSADWPATTVEHGYVDVLWENTAPHKTEYYKVYITPLSWDPTKPLLWGELIEIGSVGKGPAQSFTTVRSFIPDSYVGKRAALVSVWQRDYEDSHEAFYAVSDILVSGSGTGCATGDSTSFSFANNTNCTLEYYENNTLQGSANAGSSYLANTTVGSQWEIRDNQGNQLDTLTVVCDQPTYTSTGQCDGNSCADGDSVSITFVNNTDCTLAYHQNNTLQGSAPAGGSFVANTVIGSHWDALEPSGNRASHFHIMCGQTTFTSTGTCNTGGGCDLPEWFAGSTYVTDDRVQHNGIEYRAKWWNQGKNPEQNSAPFQVWENVGTCSGGGCSAGDAISVMFTNNTDCTLEYYQNNTLQGSANAGAHFMANTTVGTHWQARNANGDQVSHFHVMCGQTSYNSTGTCPTSGGCATGDVISVTFANNTDCTLEYYQNNTLQGSANANASFTADATVGDQWEARQASGEVASSFTIACDQTTYNTNGSCSGGSGCATAYGPYPIVYMTGDVVSHNGHNYECQVDNLFNVTPGTAAHWWKDLGPCAATTRMGNNSIINEAFNFVAFPNPAKDVINLRITNDQSATYTITIKGIDGRTLETVMLNATKGSTSISQSIKLNKLSSGIYFVNVTSGKKTLIQKFIVE